MAEQEHYVRVSAWRKCGLQAMESQQQSAIKKRVVLGDLTNYPNQKLGLGSDTSTTEKPKSRSKKVKKTAKTRYPRVLYKIPFLKKGFLRFSPLLNHDAVLELPGDPINSSQIWFKQFSFLSPNFDSKSYISNIRTFVQFGAAIQTQVESICLRRWWMRGGVDYGPEKL